MVAACSDCSSLTNLFCIYIQLQHCSTALPKHDKRNMQRLTAKDGAKDKYVQTNHQSHHHHYMSPLMLK